MTNGIQDRPESEARFHRHAHPLGGTHEQLGHDPAVWHRRIDMAPVPIVTTGESGSVTWANRAACKLLNMPSAQLAARPLAAFVGSDEQGAFDEMRAGALRATGPLHGRRFSITPRRRRPVSVLVAVAAGGTPSGERELCWALTDVSDVDRAEKALGRTIVKLERIAEAQSRRVDTAAGRLADAEAEVKRQGERLAGTQVIADFTTAVAPDAVFTVDGRGKIMSWNRAATRLFGHTAAEAATMTLNRVLEDVSTQEVADAAAETGSGAPAWIPVLARHRDDSHWKAEFCVRDASTPSETLYVCAVRRERHP